MIRHVLTSIAIAILIGNFFILSRWQALQVQDLMQQNAEGARHYLSVHQFELSNCRGHMILAIDVCFTPFTCVFFYIQ